MRLPDGASVVREITANNGWYAYYADVDDQTVSMLPVVIWATVEYEEDIADAEGYSDAHGEDSGGSVVVREIRPFVLTRKGYVIDAQEPDLEFLCILGPGVDHVDSIKRVLKHLHPDRTWDPTLNPLAN